MTPRLANDVIIIWVYYQGAVDTLYTVGFRDVSGLRIKQLQEFLKSDHWLRRYCILSGGVFYFDHPVDILSYGGGVYCESWDFIIVRKRRSKCFI